MSMPATAIELDIQLPRWAAEYRRPARYKVAYGGRGSSKSWTFARMLLLRAMENPLLVLCARELQVNIRDSVHRLLSSQIYKMGLSSYYDIGKSYINSAAGAEFIFKGLRHNTNEIQSTEGIDICWVEEAVLVSHDSWKALIPTIRKDSSEIWATFNPDQASDPTFKRFVATQPDDAIVRKINWRDNPWFPQSLDRERLYLARTDPDAYAHVWEGECRTRSDAQVLNGKWRIDVFEPQAHWNGPYFGADWGFSADPTVLVKCWVEDLGCGENAGRQRLYIEREAYGVGVELDHTPKLFDRVPRAKEHVVRADSARPETIRHMQRHGYPKVTSVKKWPGSVEEGVEHLRNYEQIVIHERCKHTSEEARLWSYKTDRLSGDVLPVLVDKHNHAWDSVRYALAPLIQRREILVW